MSQHDFNIANQSYPAFRADLNNALTALASNSSSASEPSTTYANQLWYDSTNELLKFRNEADSAWITLAYMNQTTSDWEIRSGVVQAVDSDGILFKADDGTTMASIRKTNSVLNIEATGPGYGMLTSLSNTGYLWYTNGASNGGSIYPSDDNKRDLGEPSSRFQDIYATNGTIQTSDRNEKQQIALLTDAEMTAAKSISQLFKTFKWNASVDEKGGDARIHTGVIAQEVEQAMSDAGLDVGEYGFFISTTWWETQTEVPAVEDKEAYTRTDTYDTAKEAPEGATERNRKGVRYPELLSFVGAATEQRLASIEAKLEALK